MPTKFSLLIIMVSLKLSIESHPIERSVVGSTVCYYAVIVVRNMFKELDRSPEVGRFESRPVAKIWTGGVVVQHSPTSSSMD